MQPKWTMMQNKLEHFIEQIMTFTVPIPFRLHKVIPIPIVVSCVLADNR